MPALLKARYHPVARAAWKWYIRVAIRLFFSKFAIEGPPPDPERPLLLLANHFSWWDGFWAFELNERLLSKRFHVMMSHEELSMRQFLCYAGAFSVQTNQPRSLLATLSYAANLLQEPGNMVLLFPQGRFESVYTQQPTLMRGMDYLIEKGPAGLQVGVVFFRVEWFERVRPQVRVQVRYATPDLPPAALLSRMFRGDKSETT